jgi:hypothetical protein
MNSHDVITEKSFDNDQIEHDENLNINRTKNVKTNHKSKI